MENGTDLLLKDNFDGKLNGNHLIDNFDEKNV